MKSAYVHIPFCRSICSYCDFCKLYLENKWIDNYLDSLASEIDMYYNNEELETIYIGGGTPSSLNLEQLNKLFSILKKFNKSSNLEFTFECNVEDVTEEKARLLINNGVNRISMGVQSFIPKNISLLNRHHDKDMVFKAVKILKKVGFKNINIDLMYALPGETLEDLAYDLNCFLKLDIPHISTYSLIIEKNTKLYIDRYENISEDMDAEMYELIKKKLSSYTHYEISNFSKEGYASRHNLTYWNNQGYYGFGLGATGYISHERYTNTRSLNKYLNKQFNRFVEKITKEEARENAVILGFRKIQGINLKEFKERYKISLENLTVVRALLEEKKLIIKKGNIMINDKYIYVSNDILVEFLGGMYEEV